MRYHNFMDYYFLYDKIYIGSTWTVFVSGTFYTGNAYFAYCKEVQT